MSEVFSIAIDGPAGAGKSTIAGQVAEKLGCIYVDTGAMYRAMALYLLRSGVKPELADEDPAAFKALVEERSAKAPISIDWDDEKGQIVRIGEEDVTGLIRTQEISEMASRSSAIAALRSRLVEAQQAFAKKRSVVMDGRDIGTVVLPDATVKVYLTASVEERARRRFLQDREKGLVRPIEVIQEEIRERDERDMTREASPLQKAADATEIDSSSLTIDQVVEEIINLLLVKKNARG